ncbi:carboxymuconolactone decarboxylase family protein [Knoellia sp. 3-2P3]|uniref:carboxymuconolactone decarboxylase family protein n=1 Tax=unclassified Knoellia TaxID=2618719 RepID=UPI0023D9B0C0|nr:carboxymuconolactone decarboxylase family protein [Knoellia sp. 3-2P3]MDF2092140.1 carboxymuconolactone decarboxylase family protein [Knoellia sp. 3-2P3]
MSRLEPIRPEEQDSEQRALYASITGGPRADGPQHFALTTPDGALTGPFNAFLLSPGVGGALERLGAAVRYETGLTGRTRELAILAVAAHWSSTFEWTAHEAVGRAAGLTDQELGAVRRGEVPALDDPQERASAELVRCLLRGEVSDDEWARWAEPLGSRAVFELCALVGYYAALALQLRVFRAG